MQVSDGMNHTILTVGPGHTLRAVSRLMSQRAVGAAVVMDPEGNGPGIITERDVLNAIGAGQDPDVELVADHLTRDVVFAAPEWSLEEAAAAMVHGGFRHLIVLEQGETVGILSVRDVVRMCLEASPDDIGYPLRPGTTTREGHIRGIVSSGLQL